MFLFWLPEICHIEQGRNHDLERCVWLITPGVHEETSVEGPDSMRRSTRKSQSGVQSYWETSPALRCVGNWWPPTEAVRPTEKPCTSLPAVSVVIRTGSFSSSVSRCRSMSTLISVEPDGKVLVSIGRLLDSFEVVPLVVGQAIVAANFR